MKLKNGDGVGVQKLENKDDIFLLEQQFNLPGKGFVDMIMCIKEQEG